jgi:GGDEF domain-containing protein
LPAEGLAELTRLVQSNVRRTDLLVSLGNDTLVVIAPGLDPLGGRGLSERLARLVAEHLSPTDPSPALGVAYRSPLSTARWAPAALAEEARRRAVDPAAASATATLA